MSLALITGIVIASQGIWSYAIRLSTAITDSNLDPTFSVTASLLRKDLQHAPVTPESASWNSHELTLNGDGSSSMTWRREGHNLVRYEIGADGMRTRRRILTKVENWRWKRSSGGLHEVEITISVHEDPIAAASNEKAVGMRSIRKVTRRFVIAGRGGQMSW